MNTIGNNSNPTTFWELTGSCKILFPVIQRDYAQGRRSQHATDVRKQFVEHLLTSLNNNVPESLDFIYGTLRTTLGNDKPIFVALDGQQRLTTLFLLHWYLWWRNDNLDDFCGHVSFCYETRESSSRFCQELTNTANFPKGLNQGLKPSDMIKVQNWFFASWLEDPTVNGMLVMLDEIHLQIADLSYFDLKGAMEKCKNECSNTNSIPFLSFYILYLEKGFTLADDLYVKMNARGLPLTIFENFKASFMNLLDSQQKDTFKNNIDQDWSNIFWRTSEKKDSPSVDAAMMRFVRFVVSFEYALSLHKKYKGKDYDDIPDNEKRNYESLLVNARSKVAIPTEELTFYRLNNDLKVLAPAADKIVESFGSICSLWNKDNKKLVFDNDIKKDIHEEVWKELFRKADYKVQLYLYAVILASNSENQHEWLRLVRNLVENTRIDTAELMFKSIVGMNELYQLFAGGSLFSTLPSLSNNLFSTQLEEEFDKQQLIGNNRQWRDEIHALEDHPYVIGQIKFYLKLANKDIDSFKMISERSRELFDAQSKGEQTLVRLLLLEGLPSGTYPYAYDARDLTDKQKSMGFSYKSIQYYSFANKETDRDYSWKRMLNDKPDYNPNGKETNHSKSRSDCQNLFKQLIGRNDFDTRLRIFEPANRTQLTNEIANHAGWRAELIKDKKKIEDCKNSFVCVLKDNSGKETAYTTTGKNGQFFNKSTKNVEIKIKI